MACINMIIIINLNDMYWKKLAEFLNDMYIDSYLVSPKFWVIATREKCKYVWKLATKVTNISLPSEIQNNQIKGLEILHEWYLTISNSWIVPTICHENALQYIQTILTKCWTFIPTYLSMLLSSFGMPHHSITVMSNSH
jgi:hypothetical protein